ncbi:hypothetical protein BZA77DRAFT_384825 [Pyronema omphalodes]|nr:hypothetical protein BZA77DRAFT_384825 [Pyronema omphalodes]
MDIWKGSFEVPYVGGKTRKLDDLCLSTDLQAPAPSPSIAHHIKSYLSNSSFSFLSYLPPSRVPFFLAAGPSLNLTTSSPETSDFFRHLFLSALPKLDASAAGDTEETIEQSRIALLLRVTSTDAVAEGENKGDWGITELLIYGAITYPAAPDATQTPPNSSASPAIGPTPIISVRALPLSSRHGFKTYIPVKREPGQDEARYITPNPQDILNPVISRSTKKRRADALDRAVDKKLVKKQRMVDARMALGKDAGVNTANLMPEEMMDRQGSPEPLAMKRRISMAQTEEGGLKIEHRRTSSASIMSTGISTSTAVSRPNSRGRPTLERKPTIIKKEHSFSEVAEAESKNRDLLNKIVLEEMKRLGMKDYRRDRAKSVMPTGEDMLEVTVAGEEREQWKKWEEEREEYKNVFHHTVKATIFALRRYKFSEMPVATEHMRRAVSQLLDVFLAVEKKDTIDTLPGEIET